MRNLNSIDLQGPLAPVIARRRATPSFKPDPVPEEPLRRALELASLAPSGFNLQPWRFIVVRDPHMKRKLRAAAENQDKVEQAPVMIIACGDMAAWKTDLERVIADGLATGSIPDEQTAEAIRENATGLLATTDLGIWVTRQVMIAFSFLMLALESFGLDTAPMEGFDENKVRAAFGIPETTRVVALMGIGRLAPPDKPFGGRFDLKKTVYEDHWGVPLEIGGAMSR
jgi:nitroreductase